MKKTKRSDNPWPEAMDATTKDEFIKRAAATNPRDTILHFPALLSYAESRYRDDPDDAYKSCEMICYCERYPALSEWVQTYLRNPYEGPPKALVLYGDSRLGKTLWARSLGPHAYFASNWMLEGFNDKASSYAIFDELVGGVKGIPNLKDWLGGRDEFVVGDKYMESRKIKWGKPTIYIANTDPRAKVTKGLAQWMNEKCTFVEVKEQLADGYYEKSAMQ